MKISPSKMLLVMLSCLVPVGASAQNPLLWGSLTPGKYAVGYRSSIQFDYARQYDADYTTSPKRANKPRPILVDIWYPAKKTAAKPIKYQEYLEVASSDPRLQSFVQRVKYNFREVVCEETVGKVPSKASSAEMAAFGRLMSTDTFSVKNAPPAQGRFPVVIYHPGSDGTPEDSSALFEYLASNGYVVISSLYQDADGYSVACGGGGLACSFRDMEFLSRYARGLSFADADRLSAMGHSYGGWAIFAWAAEPDSSLRSFITLDSGLEYDTVETSGAESLQYQMKMNKDTIRAASLRFASRERSANFEDIGSYLKHVPRYEATASGLTHNDFLTHGAIRPALLPQKWPEANHIRRRNYDQICKHVLYFLDATLRALPSGQEALGRSVRGEGLEAGFTLSYKPPAPALPTPRQLSEYVRQNGAAKAVELMRSLGEDEKSMTAAAHVLVLDGDAKTAIPLLRLVEKAYPKLAAAQALLGEALVLTGDREGALTAFRKGKEILDADKEGSQFWRYTIEQGLKDLGQPISPPENQLD